MLIELDALKLYRHTYKTKAAKMTKLHNITKTLNKIKI